MKTAGISPCYRNLQKRPPGAPSQARQGSPRHDIEERAGTFVTASAPVQPSLLPSASGPLPLVPTWREQGVNLVYGNWRGVFGPKGLTPVQAAFWESALRRMAQTPEWRADLEKNHWSGNFLTGAK